MKVKLRSLITVFIVITMLFSTVFASDSYGGIGQNLSGDLGPMQEPIEIVLGLIQIIGFVVAIIMVMYVGIKYLTAGAGQKAAVKSTLIPMLAGAAMVGLAPTLVKWIFEIFM